MHYLLKKLAVKSGSSPADRGKMRLLIAPSWTGRTSSARSADTKERDRNNFPLFVQAPAIEQPRGSAKSGSYFGPVPKHLAGEPVRVSDVVIGATEEYGISHR